MSEQFEQRSLRSPALQGYAWTFLEFTADKLFTFLIMALMARILGPSQFGTVAIAASFALLALPLFGNGLSQALILRKQVSSIDVHSAFWANVLVSVALVATMNIAAPWIARAYQEPDLAPMLRLMSLMWIFSAMAAIPSALLARQFKFKWLALRPFVAAVISLVVCVILVLNGFGAMSLVAYYILRAGTLAAVAFIGSGYMPKMQLSLSSLRSMARLCGDSVASSVLYHSTSLVTTVIVGYLLDPAAAGFFRMAQMLVDTVKSALFQPLARVAYAAFGRISDSVERVRGIYVKMTILANMIAIPVVGGLIVVSQDVATTALGAQWQLTGLLAQILALTLTPEALISVMRPAMFSIGQSRATLYRTAVDAASFPVAVVIAAPFGIVAVASALALRALLFAAYPLYLVRRHFGIEPAAVLRRSLPSIIATAIMVGACFLLRQPLLAIMPIYAVLVVEVVLGALVYLTVVRILRPPALGDAVDVVHPAIRPRLLRVPVVRWLFVAPPQRLG